MSEPRPDGPRRESGAAAERRSRPDETGTSETPDSGELLAQIAAEARDAGRDVAQLLRVGVDRLRLQTRERAFRLIVLGWLAAAVIAATALAAIFVVDGVAGLLTEALDGRIWAGRLAAGMLVLGSIGLAILVRRGSARRAELRRLTSKYPGREGKSERGGPP